MNRQLLATRITAPPYSAVARARDVRFGPLPTAEAFILCRWKFGVFFGAADRPVILKSFALSSVVAHQRSLLAYDDYRARDAANLADVGLFQCASNLMKSVPASLTNPTSTPQRSLIHTNRQLRKVAP